MRDLLLLQAQVYSAVVGEKIQIERASNTEVSVIFWSPDATREFPDRPSQLGGQFEEGHAEEKGLGGLVGRGG